MEISVDKCLEMIRNGESFVLATVIASEGSVPRGAGARMTIDISGNITGSVGGGVVEYKTIQTALDVLKNCNSLYITYSLAPGNKHSIGMLCGGTVKILVEYIDANDPINLSVFEQIQQAVIGKTSASLVTIVENKGDGLHIDRSVFYQDQANRQVLPQWYPENGSMSGFKAISVDSNRRVILENLSSTPTVCILGGGHIGFKLAELVNFAGYRTVVVDDRPDFVTRERYPYAHEIYVIENYTDVFDSVSIDENSYIVIVTKDVASDRRVLEQSLQTKARYIGMIGGKTKTQNIFNYLKNKGYDSNELGEIHTPIGIPINAETASEIAISIISEIVKEMRTVNLHESARQLSAA